MARRKSDSASGSKTAKRSAKAARQGAGPGGRERLLEAAITRFSEQGYAATGIAEVCREAGVAKTALYWHFESKEGLLAAVIERVGTQWIDEIQKGVYLEGDAQARAQRLVDGCRRIVLEQPELLRLPLVAQLEQGESDVGRAALRGIWQRAEKALSEGIEDTVGVSLPDVDLLAHTVFVLLQGAMVRQISQPDAEQLERILADLERTIILLVADRLPEGVELDVSARARVVPLQRGK